MTVASVNDNSNFASYLKKQVTNKIKNAESAILELFGGNGADIVELAKKFLGTNEADGTADKFVNGGSSSAIPWCAAFVQYIIEHAKGNNSGWFNNVANKWDCVSIYESASSSNAVVSSTSAKPGDIVLFDWNGDGEKDHVGIVESNKNGQITTIEGNSSDMVKSNTYDANDNRLTFCSIS